MPQDDDFGFDMDLDSPQKRAAPIRGRRSTPHQSPRTFVGPGSPSSGVFSGPEDSPSRSQPPPRSRKTGGWATDAFSTSFSSKKQAQRNSDTKTTSSRFDQYDSDSDMPIIPDLDDVQEEEFAAEIAQAPSVPSNRIATFQELDSDLLKHSAFTSLDGIDLRILTKCLSPESEVREEDVPWTWDVLFTDVASSLNDEWEEKKSSETVNSASTFK